MVAALALGLEENMDTKSIAKLAAAASTGACLTEGTSPADYATVQKLI
jgi:fructose-1-phosphate kinase PfkB-like protein